MRPERLLLRRDDNGYPTFGLSVTAGKRVTLAASTEITIPIVPTATDAIFSFSVGTDVWVTQSNTSLTIPGAAVEDSISWLNPVAREIDGSIGAAPLRFICETPAFVNVLFYKIDNRG
ncbi:MAG: hypothetical protein ACPGVV_01910 [Croceimicrobium sp.]